MITGILLATAGVATHFGYFNRGEHHVHGLRYLQGFICAYILLTLTFVQIAGLTIKQSLSAVVALALPFLVGLYGSLIIYRLAFHPLKSFQGPLSCRISSLCFSARLLSLDAHRQLLALHQRYGDFVRVGSLDLSIIHPKTPDAIYGRKSK